MDDFRWYRDLAVGPDMALQEVELSGPGHVASSPEPSVHGIKASQACARPAAISKLHSGSQVMPGSDTPAPHLSGLLQLL